MNEDGMNAAGEPGAQDAGTGGTLSPDQAGMLPQDGGTAGGTVPEGTGVPEKYGPWTLPENLDAQDPRVSEALREAEGAFRELGLNQVQAQRLIDLHMKHYMGGLAESQELFEQEMTKRIGQWDKQVEGDPEFGGIHLTESLGLARRAINELGGPALDKALKETGAAHHPAIFAFLVRTGRRLAEDRFVQGMEGPKTRGNSPEDIAARLYPDMIKGN